MTLIKKEEITTQVNLVTKHLPVMTFDHFVHYLCDKIDPERIYLITSSILLSLEKSYIEDFGNEWIRLTRNEKRKKKSIYQGLYKNVNLIYETLECDPNRYLRYSHEAILKKYPITTFSFIDDFY